MKQVNVELKKSETQKISLNDSDVRKLADKASGVISLNDLHGKRFGETVTNYKLFSGSWTGSKQEGKAFSAKCIIPHNIINGTISVIGDLSTIDGSFINSSLTVSNIPLSYNGAWDGTYSGSAKFVDSTIRELSINGNTGRAYAEPPKGEYYAATMTLTITFTGEWEL